MRAVSFKGIEAHVTGYEKDYTNRAPSLQICINDGKELISAPPFADGRPFPEYFREKIGSVLKKSSLWHKNSEMRILQDIPRTSSVSYPVSKYAKIEQEYTGTMYKGKIYFCDLDEALSSSKYKDYTAVVSDSEPILPSLRNVERSYASAADFRILKADSQLTVQKKLESILDYCARKKNLPELCEKTTETINNLLKLVKNFDEALAKGESSQVTENLIKIRDFYKKQLSEYLTQNRNIFYKR